MMGRRRGRSAISPDEVVGSLPGQSATSVLVPPMSKVMMSVNPANWATNCAPTTPPAGPDKAVRAACSPAVWALIMPPLLCITARRRGFRPPANRAR
jgi:hypothetical protein